MQQTALQDGLGQFFDKQRNTVGAVGDLLDDLIGQRLAAGDLRNQNGPVTPVQTVERKHRYLRQTGPGRLVLRRNVTIRSTGRVRRCSTVRSSNSREVGSIQWASS